MYVKRFMGLLYQINIHIAINTLCDVFSHAFIFLYLILYTIYIYFLLLSNIVFPHYPTLLFFHTQQPNHFNSAPNIYKHIEEHQRLIPKEAIGQMKEVFSPTFLYQRNWKL